MKYSPLYYSKLKKRYPTVAASFDKLAESCAEAGPLDRKTQHLVKLGVAIGLAARATCRTWPGRP
jgi:alkylhydroperoxidase/carboxymuconolactone decarboxylase family protein YurZ